MPAPESVGFEDEERLFPVLHATGKEDEPEALGLHDAWLVDLAAQDD